jgi:membrane protein
VYWFVPNTRVRAAPALAGGLAGGIVWAATGALFARFVVNSAQQLSTYAGFAIVISALIWLHLCWLILLLGAQVAFYIQHPDYLRLGYRRHAPGGRDTESLALAVMLRVARPVAGGGPRPAATDLAEELRLPGIVLAPVLAQLEDAGLLARSGDDELLPDRPPERILVREVLAAVRVPVRPDPVLAVDWPAPVGALAARVGTAIEREFGAMTLADMVAAGPPAGG